MSDEKKTYIFWLDLIRVTSIFMVILIHASSPVMNAWGEITLANWMAGDVYTSLARACVPLLFMVSGYLLLGKQESLSAFYIGRIKKVVLPFLAWSVIYLLWLNSYGNYTFLNAIKSMVVAIITGPAFYHLWFLYALLPIYLFVPVLRIFVRSADNQTLWYFALTWFVFGPLLDSVENLLGIGFAINLGFITEYIGYFFLGYLLGHMKFPRWAILLAVFIFTTMIIFTVYKTFKASAAFGDYDDFFLVYLRLNIVLMSLSAFIWLKALGEKISGNPEAISVRFIRKLSGVSFGIYLVHAMMLTFLRRGAFGFAFSALSGPAIYTAPLVTFLVFCISWLIIWTMQKTPFLRAIVPS